MHQTESLIIGLFSITGIVRLGRKGNIQLQQWIDTNKSW